jgi:hypothetical protein
MLSQGGPAVGLLLAVNHPIPSLESFITAAVLGAMTTIEFVGPIGTRFTIT